jgi:arylsulfatase A-like enzyme
MTPPGEWFDRHAPGDMALPSSIDDPMEHSFGYLRHLASITADRQRGWVGMLGASDHEMVRESVAATYGMIEFVDDGVGRIMAAVERLGQLDNTIVVFTSDHGDMMGDHGLMLKGFIPYRGTLQVPFVVADPRRAPATTSSLAGSIDLGPTLMDLCGIEPHDGMQGHSLVPLLDDPTATVRDHVLVEDDIRAVAAARVGLPTRIRTLVTDEGWKYSRNDHGETMLFDLAADPAEVHELSHHDDSRRARADSRLVDALMSATDDARGAPVA